MIKMYEVRDSKDGNLYSLVDMVDMYDEEPVNYSYVSKRLECPHCGKKNIRIRITDDFASITSRREQHEVLCDYYPVNINQRQIKKLISDKVDFSNYFDDFRNKAPKQIPRKSLERLLAADDFDVYKLFYGQVVLKTAHSKDESRYVNYSIKAPKGDIINLTFKGPLIAQMASTIEVLDAQINKTIDVMFIGLIKEVDTYNNVIIEHPSMFQVTPVKNESN